MQQNEPLIKVRDRRKDNRFYLDNEYLDGYAKKVGWQSSLVYMALCRHARNERCFPAIKHLATELGIGRTSVKVALRRLRDFNIITWKTRTRMGQGRGSNEYFLLDRSQWKPVSGWSNRKVEGWVAMRP